MTQFGPYLRSVMAALTDVEVAELVADDNDTFSGITPTSQETRDYKSAVISNIREFQRRYPSDLGEASKNFADSIAAVPPPPPPVSPPAQPGVPLPSSPAQPGTPVPIGGGEIPGGKGGSFGTIETPPQDTPPGASGTTP
jgi:hypothetical protein